MGDRGAETERPPFAEHRHQHSQIRHVMRPSEIQIVNHESIAFAHLRPRMTRKDASRRIVVRRDVNRRAGPSDHVTVAIEDAGTAVVRFS